MNYSRKRLVCVPESRNTESVLDNKHIYCQMMSSVPDESIIFLDSVQRMLENFNPDMSGYFRETKHQIEQGDTSSQKMHLLTVQQIMQARNRIKNYVRRTPLEFSPFLSQRCRDSKVYIKCENLQLTGSFKIRGAFNKVCLLKEKDANISKRGAVSASTGNHALACTEAMNQLGVPIRVFVPENISSAKHERLKVNNAILTLHGQDCIFAENAARKYSEENKIPFISPYNDIDVAAGQGTIGIEIFEDLPDVDNVLVPVGGGGLIGGIAAYLKGVNPRIKVYGCQPIQSKVMYESIKAGSIIFEESGDTLSDGTSGGIEENSVTFELCRNYVDHWLLVEEEHIAKAIYFMLSHHHMMIEGAAGVSLGAFMTNMDRFAGQKTVIIACGANISMEKLKKIIQMEEEKII